jgi:putative phage-type endonuclease
MNTNIQDSSKTRELSAIELSIYKFIKSQKRDYQNDGVSDTRTQKILSYIQQLNKLLELPLIKQRTTEWYEARKTRLTASDLDEAIKPSNNRLAMKKAGIIEDTTNYNTLAPLKWGTMFEAMAIRSYSQERDDITVHEFGLIKHPFLENFGASPDGINDLGIMIEIKCPYSRSIIDNSIPNKYYKQIQGQLAVCELEECDYVECDFQTYENIPQYIEDIKEAKSRHGVIAEYKNRHTEEYEYIYSDKYLTASAASDDINKKIMANNNNDLLFLKVTPWKLRNINVQRVTFDKDLWDNTVPKITDFWNKVLEYKKNPTVVKSCTKAKKYAFIADDD